MSRTKPKATIINGLKQAEGAVAEIASLDRQIKAVELDMQETVDQVKAHAKADAEPLQRERKALADAVATFAALNKTDLFKKKKSLDLGFGTIGFRLVTKLATLPKFTLEKVLEKLHDYGHADAIRVKESVDKEAMRAWSDEKLETVGMRRKVEDEFFLEIPEEQLGTEGTA